MQGIFINGSRPKTKKALREQLERINNYLSNSDEYPQGAPNSDDPYSVVIEATSWFGNEFDGSLAKAMDCKGPCNIEDLGKPDEPAHQHPGPFYIVGPDPYTSRKWYAKLEYTNDEWRLS